MDSRHTSENEPSPDLGDGPPPSIGPGLAPRPPTSRSWLVEEVLRPWAVVSLVLALLFTAGYIALPFFWPTDAPEPHYTIEFERTRTTTAVVDGVRHWDVRFDITRVVRGGEDVTWHDVNVMVYRSLRGGPSLSFVSGNASGPGAGAPTAVYEDRAGKPTTIDEGDRFTLVDLDRTFQGASIGFVFMMTFASDFHSEQLPLGMWKETLSLELDAPTAQRVDDPVGGATWSFGFAVGNVTPGDERVPWRDVLLVLLTPGNGTDDLPSHWLDYPFIPYIMPIVSEWTTWRIVNGTDDGCIAPGDLLVVEGVTASYQAGEGHGGAILLFMTGSVCLDYVRLPVLFP